jgi:hypothetical protein
MYAEKIRNVVANLGALSPGFVNHKDEKALYLARRELLALAEGVEGMEANCAPVTREEATA